MRAGCVLTSGVARIYCEEGHKTNRKIIQQWHKNISSEVFEKLNTWKSREGATLWRRRQWH